MSMRALLKSVEARLRAADVLNDQPAQAVGKVCGVQKEGKPPQNCGQWYYAIHQLGIRGDDQNALSNDRLYDIGVTITARMGYVPDDRVGQKIISDDQLLDQAEYIADVLHMDYESMNAANALIPGTAEYVDANGGDVATNGFEEPLKFGSIGLIEEKPAGWVGSKETAQVLAVLVKMVGAKRVRYIGS